MKSVISIIVLASVMGAFAVTDVVPTLNEVFNQIEDYERDTQSDNAIKAGNEFVKMFGFKDFNTVLVTNSGLIIVIEGEYILERGQSVDLYKDTKVKIAGKKHKVLRTLQFKNS